MTPPCPCGLPNVYDDCCGRFHAGAPAPSAEALMRSRYCAYVLQLGDYLLATWHHSTRPGAIDFDEAPKWLGLTIKQALPQPAPQRPSAGDALQSPHGKSLRPSHGDSLRSPHRDSLRSQKKPGNATLAEQDDAAESTNESPTDSTVEFIARYKIAGRAYRLHETSRFVREDGRWFYLDGEIH